MKLRHLGYACINLSIVKSSGKTFRLANLTEEKARETIKQSLENLKEILEWNKAQGIYLFRISSEIIPFASHENFTLDWLSGFKNELSEIRRFVKKNNLRLSMHPGQYTVLNSPRREVLDVSLKEVEWQSQLIEHLDPEGGMIVIHVGGVYGNKETAKKRFIDNFSLLSPLAQSKLTIENDDKSFDMEDVLEICAQLKTPIIWDIFHHKCNHRGNDWKINLIPKLEQMVMTWHGKIPKLHISSQKPGTRTSHSDYILKSDFEELIYLMKNVPPAEAPFDLMIEAKMKDKALLALKENEEM